MELIEAKTILSSYQVNTVWFGSHYTMNIYKGCNHGCIYCDSRSDCYKIDDFDRIRAKANALVLIEQELKRKRKTGVIGTGSMSDPYNPFEEEYHLTRSALALIHRYGYGLALFTKSELILRDQDLLKEISCHSPVLIGITITTADDELSRKIEQNVCVSSKRFEAIKQLSDQGLFAGIILMPVLPFIEDNPENIRALILNAHEHHAKFIYTDPHFGVTLRTNQRDWFFNKLDLNFPGLKDKYSETYGNNYACSSLKSKQLWRIFTQECEKFGILYRMSDIIQAYQQAYGVQQLSIFDEE